MAHFKTAPEDVVQFGQKIAFDLDELNNNERREGMFGAVYWWMVKLGTAVSG